VNGVAPAIGRVKMANKIIIQKETNKHDGSNHKKTSVKTSVSTKKRFHKCPKCSKQRRKHKIIIAGDSHTRGLASNLKHNLNNDFDLNGFVKPGADINMITSSLTVDSKHLTSNDILVLWGGTNDVSKNNSKDGLKSLTEFVEIHNTNIALMCVPHRHDLPNWSCVNNEVATYNRNLIKLMKPHKHVTMVRTDLDRKFFTKHGMHMNKLGKERIALEMANTVVNILLEREKVISLQWKNAQGDSVSDSPTEDNVQWKNAQGDSE
jgi:hypothetical protein